MASTVGWSFFRYRALEEPNRLVMPRSIPGNPAEDEAQNVPNLRKNLFHIDPIPIQ